MIRVITLMLALTLTLTPSRAEADSEASATRFATIDIVLDTHDTPLAAYQLAFEALAGDVKIVGIEGGEHPAYSEPPYYDPQAIQQERVILAAFNTANADDLPTGKTRVATIHVQITGDTKPQYTIDLTVAADVRGERIENAQAQIQEPES